MESDLPFASNSVYNAIAEVLESDEYDGELPPSAREAATRDSRASAERPAPSLISALHTLQMARTVLYSFVSHGTPVVSFVFLTSTPRFPSPNPRSLLVRSDSSMACRYLRQEHGQRRFQRSYHAFRTRGQPVRSLPSRNRLQKQPEVLTRTRGIHQRSQRWTRQGSQPPRAHQAKVPPDHLLGPLVRCFPPCRDPFSPNLS